MGLLAIALTGAGMAWAQRADRPADAPNPVRVETVPSGAKIRVDGQVVADPEETTLLLPPGAHTIHVSRGNLAARTQVLVVQGEAHYIKLEMTPQDAALRIQSDPAGSDVKVDGKPAGRTPVTLKLPSGRHEIQIDQVGYPPLTAPVELDAGWETAMKVQLAREVATRSEWSHPSTWNWKRRLAMGIGTLALVYGFGEVAAVSQSNARQDKLRDDAQSASNLAAYQSIVSQIQDERKRGQYHSDQASYGYGVALVALVAAYFANGPREGVRGSSIEVTAAPAPDGSPLLAVQWGF